MDQVLEDQNVFSLPDLDFREAREKIPTPDQLPDAAEVARDLPFEVKRSATVEALLAQNDDLMARLKVNLRRLTLLENENERLRLAMSALEGQNSALADQRQVFHEKESRWLEKEKRLEEIVHEFQTRLPNYEGLVQKLDIFKAYHERIQNQVKPFVHQLKGYSENLALEIQKLNAEIARRDDEIRALRVSRAEIEAQIDDIRHQSENRQALLTEHHERIQNQYKMEIQELQAQVQRLEERSQNYDEQRAREDELTNVIIALRRQKEDLIRENQEREQDLREELGNLRVEVTQLKTSSTDAQQKADQLRTEYERISSQNHQLQEQISSLRFMWNSKTEECEKLSSEKGALDRLNVELSRQLTSLRRESEAEGLPRG